MILAMASRKSIFLAGNLIMYGFDWCFPFYFALCIVIIHVGLFLSTVSEKIRSKAGLGLCAADMKECFLLDIGNHDERLCSMLSRNDQYTCKLTHATWKFDEIRLLKANEDIPRDRISRDVILVRFYTFLLLILLFQGCTSRGISKSRLENLYHEKNFQWD